MCNTIRPTIRPKGISDPCNTIRPTIATAAAAPAAAAPPSSVAKQLADVKSMFEQELIPSREIYENKVRQILGLS